MADEFTEVTRQGWGGKIGGSLVGVLVGIVLFFGSFIVLFLNEGRVDLSKFARNSAVIDIGSRPAGVTNGQIVSLGGVVNSGETLGDGLFLKNGKYIEVIRNAEMYAWVEHKKTETRKDAVGGGSTTVTTYSYTKEWTDNPGYSFHKSGHENPVMAIKSAAKRVSEIKMGLYKIPAEGLDLPDAETLSPLTPELVNIKEKGRNEISGEYIYNGRGSIDSPGLGDLRISYRVLRSGFTGTAFGSIDIMNMKLVPFFAGNKRIVDKLFGKLYRVFNSDRQAAISTLHGEFETIGWILRAAGFIMMWLGIFLVFEPISMILDIVSVIGSVSRFLIGGMSFLIALPLTIITIIISMIAHSLAALAVVAAAGIILTIIVIRKVPGKPAKP